MTSFLISLDEVDRVKRAHHIETTKDLAEKTGVSRNTWSAVLKHRQPSASVLGALARLGARPSKILVLDTPTIESSAA
ncbi:helix-turn-helix transcriptional regulator [Corynebacterium argentoratense]|jgi:transcriptional regulator with XRE-family HTH domain|uniref:helix-turn-helix domain-containing protein n=1 Tax=Corynebacterium argentoratense TaxID=42817 RepID=UPI0028EA7E9E|nr:helix-turn-helix transcriptional regulator [Corynebacterium argentoratense]